MSATLGGFGLSLSPEETSCPSSPSRAPETKQFETIQKSTLILLVEDNPADVHLVEMALREHQVAAELQVMRDGESALRLIDEISAASRPHPELVILDLNLPRKSGREILGRLRASPELEGVPVAILSSSDAKKDREEAASLGANLYIRKPSDLDEFMSIGALLKALISGSDH